MWLTCLWWLSKPCFAVGMRGSRRAGSQCPESCPMLTPSEAYILLYYLLMHGLLPSRNSQLETLLLQSQTELQNCMEASQ